MSNGKDLAKQIAEEIVNVQPMDPNLFKNLIAASTPREKLIEEGYKPVSRMGLLWIKE